MSIDKGFRIKKQVEAFSLNMLNDFRNYITIYKEFLNINLEKILPEIFFEKNISVITVYSVNKNHIMIYFKKSDSNLFQFKSVKNDVIDCFDETGNWKTKNFPVAFKIVNGSVNINGCTTEGLKPFEFEGDNFIAYLNKFHMFLPNEDEIEIEYALIMSLNKFYELSKNVKEFVRELILTYENTHDNINKNKIMEYKLIQDKMKNYIYSNNTGELELDNFFRDNPIVLEVCLGIVKPMSQIVLKDVCYKYSQDLKPDLIAYNLDKKKWQIIDYKKANKSLLKNIGEVRCSFRDDLNLLQNQLRDYVEYFEEKEGRVYFSQKYGEYIENPNSIGIIGIVDENEVKDFNRQEKNLPRWIEIIPYNYLYEKFSRYIERIENIN